MMPDVRKQCLKASDKKILATNSLDLELKDKVESFFCCFTSAISTEMKKYTSSKRAKQNLVIISLVKLF